VKALSELGSSKERSDVAVIRDVKWWMAYQNWQHSWRLTLFLF